MVSGGQDLTSMVGDGGFLTLTSVAFARSFVRYVLDRCRAGELESVDQPILSFYEDIVDDT